MSSSSIQRTSRRAVVGALALAVLATGCSGEPAAPPSQNPEQGGGAAPAGAASTDLGSVQADPESRRNMAEMAIYRTWDPCALHDPTAAAKVFGDAVALIEPSDFTSCLLRVNLDRTGSRGWRIYTRVGSPFLEDDVAGATVLDAAGRKFHGKKSAPGSTPGCDFVMQTSKTKTLQLQVNWGGMSTETPPKDSCEAAKEYMTAIAPFFANPPLRSEAQTEPQLPLASKDPCAPVKELVEKFRSMSVEGEQPSAIVTGMSPNTCTLSFSSRYAPGKKTKPQISIDYKWGIDPAEGISGGAPSRQVQIEGKPAKVEDHTARSLGSCMVQVQYDAMKIPAVDRVQVVQVAAPDCQTAEEAAKIVTKVALA
ncbi:hypothetical protein NLX83_33690 [Allokutzneria sp. A3M-2-11 16]|uniref:hypothetical protein n=1 Tax=Allokutzneria sp. A3M-2-11 16 TaxID=2962043 RepID=UPI0020B8EE78|nr:hypothetical protein [Allokutzneria sp. A3M-2-11 16]MCP3804238.1 hypothetical protein [Allokutzneria sp. A3M-2-11 16]